MLMRQCYLARPHSLAYLTLGLTGLALVTASAQAALTFLGVAAGDVTSTDAIVWTRAVDAAAPANTTLTIEITTDATFASGIATVNGTTDSSKDYTCKVDVSSLAPNTAYYYRFVGPAGEASIVGKFKTAPTPTTAAPLHFAFSGDNDGLMRPYALASVFPSLNLDFYINLGDVIYENASKVAGNIGLSYTNSPSVTLSSDSLSFNGIPRAFIPGGAPFATRTQLKADYEKKYRENFLPVNTGGQNSLQALYAAQGNYTTWDNHELGNRKYIDGGAPAGGSVGGADGLDMSTGRGVDARNNGAGNVGNTNDVNVSATDFMNRTTGFQTLENVFLAYQPIADRGTISAPGDARTDGTKQLYSATPWGKNALYINTDSRSYRDIRLKTATGSADDTGTRADNPARTYLGATQFAWLKQTLLTAEQNGVPWKFVSVSDPIDQLGPIGGTLTGTLTSVNADGGKAYMGGYRAERNALLKFIVDNRIKNVVFLATDDHQNRINELSYSPTGQTDLQASYVKVPYCFSIVCGPLGATGPDTITDHSFTNIKAIADSLANAQTAAGIDPIGLQNYPGLHDVVRENDPTAATSPQAVDFYSPDTFNFTGLDVTADGKTLTVSSIGMNSTAQNAATEYANGPQARTIFSFQVTAAAAPQFTASPDNTTVSADPGQCSAWLNFLVTAYGFPTPTVTTTLDGMAITSPYLFPKGISIVNCVASNVVGVATTSFTVTVKDTEAPIVAAVKTRLSHDEKKGARKEDDEDDDVYYVLRATDNCDSRLQIFVRDSAQGDCGGSFVAGPYAPGTKVKLSRHPNKPSLRKGSDGVAAKIKTVGNPVLVVTDSSGNTSCTKVVLSRED